MKYEKFQDIEKTLQNGKKEVVVEIIKSKFPDYSRDMVEMAFQKELPKRKITIGGYGSKYYVHVK